MRFLGGNEKLIMIFQHQEEKPSNDGYDDDDYDDDNED